MIAMARVTKLVLPDRLSVVGLLFSSSPDLLQRPACGECSPSHPRGSPHSRASEGCVYHSLPKD
jgi:hypothetical protein